MERHADKKMTEACVSALLCHLVFTFYLLILYCLCCTVLDIKLHIFQVK